MNIKRLLPALICVGLPFLAAAGTPIPRTINVTFTVNSVADSVDVNPGDSICQDASGQCSLRAAIMEANALTGPDTIVFDPITDGQPQLLQIHGAGENAAATGDLDITEGLTITGNGTGKTIIDGDGADRVFDILSATGTVEIDDLTIQNGNNVIKGGGIEAFYSTLILKNDLIQNSTAQNLSGVAEGGGIYGQNALVTLDNTTVKGNTASASSAAYGGGVASDNSTPATGVLSILDGSLVTGNLAQGGSYLAAGGGVSLLDDSALTMDSSAVRSNQATDTDAGGSADGGGIVDALNNSNGAYSISNSEISGNTAHGNASAFGGGVNTNYVAVNSAFVNTTISGNSAIADNGSTYGGGVGLATTGSGVTELLGNVTLSGNSVQGVATQGGGIAVYNNTGTVSVRNTIVAGNLDANATAPDCVGASGGTLTSGGYNMIGDDTGCSFANATGDQVGTGSAPIDPLLGTLANNGGKTQTMALLAGSPAVDAGNPAGCKDASDATLTRDQRNSPRPEDGNASGTAICDIGAYERAADTPPIASNGSVSTTVNNSVSGTLTASDPNGDALIYSIASQPAHGTVTLTNTSTGAFRYTPTQKYKGSDSFTFTVNDGFVDSSTATETVTVKSAPSSGGGGGGSLGGFALLALFILVLVPWWLRRHAPTTAKTVASAGGDLPMKRAFRLHLLAAACAALTFCAVLAAVPAHAAPGDVDTTFNGGVPAVIDPGTGNIYDVLAGAINPSNGDIFWSGNYNVSSGAIAAYKPDGTPDTAFGGVGEVILTAGAVGFSGGTMQLNGIAVDGQGRILLTGVAYDSSGGGMLVMRLNPDGSFDTSFGSAGTGYVIVPLGQSEGTGLSLTADGHILVTGDAYDNGTSQHILTIWRFSADGIPDSLFGTNGYVQITAIKDSLYLGCKPGLQPDDSLLVGCEQGGASNWVAVHIIPDGSLDTGFGSSGFVTSTPNMDLYGLALAPDNSFVIGEADYNSPPPTDLRRFLADGSVDASFNSGNPFDLSTLMGTATRLPVGAQADAKALVSGNNGATTLNVVRLLTNGTLDSNFGTNGVGTVDFSNIGGSGYTSEPTAVLLQGDGKIVILGYAVNNTDSRRISFVTRLDNDAFNFTPASFSFMAQIGVALSSLITSNAITVSGLSSGTSVPVSVSGGEYQINAGAWTSTPGFTRNGDQIAVRHTSSSSFNTQTKTTLTVGGQVIANNNSTVLGSTTSATFTTTTKARSSGGGGSSSGGGGFGWLALLGLFILALAPQRLQRLRGHTRGDVARQLLAPAVTGYVLALTLTGLVAAAPAFAAPGDVDTTFNGGIPAILDLNPSGEVRAYGAAINPINSDILWSGYALTPVGSGGAITAYKPDGTLDTGVGGGSGEIVLTADQAGAPGGQVNLYAIAVDEQGRILASGIVSNSSSFAMVLARFKPDGTLDTAFGAGGTGVVTDSLNTTAIGTGLSLTSDGHILVTGSAANAAITEAQLTVWRFNPDGTADAGFGDNGHIQLPEIAGTGLELCLAALQPDGALIAGFPSTSGGSWKIARLNPDGSVDTTFGASGFITGSTGLSLAGLALAPDGGLVISELDQSSSPPPIDLRRYLADGTVDSGFNGGNPLDFGTLPGPSAFLPVAVQPDGKIVASGNGGSNSLVVARLLADGVLDSNFGNVSAGISAIDFNSINGNNYTPGATALLLQGNGKIVASGYANSSAGTSYAAFVTRVDNDAFTLLPGAFSFMDQTGVDRSTTVTSNAISVSGLSSSVSVPVSVSGGEYKVNSGAWTTDPGLVRNGDQVAVRHTSSASYSTSTTTTLTIGGQTIPNNYSTVLGTPVSASFSSTTKSAPTSGGGGGGGGGGSIALLALLALLTLAFVPWSMRYKHQRFSK